jgi:tetratricopeptide (TPR) repeat protein
VPSLEDLDKFRSLFRKVGKESEDLMSKGVLFDDLDLPVDDESSFPRGNTSPRDENFADDDIMTERPGAAPNFDFDDLFDDAFAPAKSGEDVEAATDNLFNFDDLFDSGESNSSAPVNDFPHADGDAAPGESGSPQEDSNLDDLPDFNDNAAPPPMDADFPHADDNDASSEGGSPQEDFNLGDLPDFNDNAASSEDGSPQEGFNLGDLPDFNDNTVSSEDGSPQEDFNLGDLPDFDDNAASSEDGSPQEDFNLGDLPDFNDNATPNEGGSPQEDFNLGDLPDFNDNAAPSEGGFSPARETADGMASDSQATDFEQPDSFIPEALSLGEEVEDFEVPGLDDILNKSAAPLSGLPKSSDNIEEIILSEQDYEHLKNALASYPLNLRIACEELIAEEAVEPDLMSKLIALLVEEAHAQEVADLAGKIQGRIINIPKGFEKKTGADLEAEKNSFKYIFIHKVLPVAGFTLFGILVALSIVYLVHQFIYIPLHAESIYKQGYALIDDGKYPEANKKFTEAFKLHPVKKWFYRYAEAFVEKRQFLFAEEKYETLLMHYPKEKQAALDYAALETNRLQNYEKADSILRTYILNYAVSDKDALFAIGDNALAWGEIDPSKYELAREAYARYIEDHGQNDSVLERMLKYFIRVDNLKEVLPLQRYFSDPEMEGRRSISAETFTEMSGYLLDRQFEETDGVPDEYVSQITDVRGILLKAVEKDPSIPETHYNLSRYYHYFGNTREERIALERALPLFDADGESSVKRTKIRLDAERRYAETLIANKEFFAAEERLQKGIELYEDALFHNFIQPDPQAARLYANMGDLEYFTKDGDMDMALRYYARAEQNGWSPPEMQYRMGSAHYHLQEWAQAQERFTAAADMTPYNRRILNALGNVAYIRGDYFTAQAYYSRLLAMLNADKNRFAVLSPQTRPDHFTLAERLMTAENNMGVTLETLTTRTGDPEYKRRALDHYINSSRAWDSLTRDPQTLIRAGMTDLASPGVNLASLNSRNAFSPEADYEPQIYVEIDKDMQEPSLWETLAPQNIRMAEALR